MSETLIDPNLLALLVSRLRVIAGEPVIVLGESCHGQVVLPLSAILPMAGVKRKRRRSTVGPASSKIQLAFEFG